MRELGFVQLWVLHGAQTCGRTKPGFSIAALSKYRCLVKKSKKVLEFSNLDYLGGSWALTYNPNSKSTEDLF